MDEYRTPVVLNEQEPIRDRLSLELLLKSAIRSRTLPPVMQSLAEQIAGRPDALASTSHAALFVRQALMQRLGENPGDVEAMDLLKRVLEHEAETLGNRRAYIPGIKSFPNAVHWPNMEDKDQPRHVHDELPYARTFPIIDRSTPIGSAGSCFAMEMAHWLRANGYTYVVTEENPDSCAAWGPIFNVPAFRQLVEKAFGLRQLPRLLWSGIDPKTGRMGYREPFREETWFPSLEAYEEDHDRHLEAAREALLQAKVFIITLGLNEVWYMKSDGSVLSRNPWRFSSSLVERRILTVEENVAELQRMLDVWRQFNPELKLIVSVSPVPMLATFRGEDTHVVAATKSTLRVAAEEFVRRNRDVYYMPSYETVMYCTPEPFQKDGRHVTREAVSKVMDVFQRIFVKPEPVASGMTQGTISFLSRPDWQPGRKGPEEVVRAYLSAFDEQDPVTLGLWLPPGSGRNIEEAETEIARIIAALGLDPEHTPDMVIIDGVGTASGPELLSEYGRMILSGTPGDTDLASVAQGLSAPMLSPDPVTLRRHFEDARETENIRNARQSLQALAIRTSQGHPMAAAAPSLVHQYVEAQAGYRQKGLASHAGYVAQRELFHMTHGHFNLAIADIQSRIRPVTTPADSGPLLGLGGDLDLSRVLSDLDRDGLHVFGQVLPADMVDRLVRFALETPAIPQRPPATDETPIRFDPDHPRSVKYSLPDQDVAEHADIQSILGDGGMLAIAEAFLGCHPILDNTQMWWSTSLLDQPDSGAAQMFHCDQDRLNFLNFFIYLSDVTTDTGCHTYVRGSNRGRPMPLRRDGRYTDDEVASLYRPEDIVEVCGPRGTMFVANTKGLHKGKMLRHGNRLMLQFVFSTDLFGAPWKPLEWTETMESGLGDLARTHPRLFRRFGAWT